MREMSLIRNNIEMVCAKLHLHLKLGSLFWLLLNPKLSNSNTDSNNPAVSFIGSISVSAFYYMCYM